ncbi:hypothetical protein BU068_11245 [Staphylococcus succinus]|uniref:hypothetical protein n=1 Tax=Staphylococcus succinus TaxID=61015 RepID=UPI000E678285|nr:hypothetical protein [Staphylococcus succinus]RIN30495.1 hypothetical protein BU068_11245 [Staphylococcus succinus]
MMQITPSEVKTYLQLIKDENPLHNHIVPGQMIVQIVFAELKLKWSTYKIKYIEIVEVTVFIQFEYIENEKVSVTNLDKWVKIHILKN